MLFGGDWHCNFGGKEKCFIGNEGADVREKLIAF